jgi:hypothetical protein
MMIAALTLHAVIRPCRGGLLASLLAMVERARQRRCRG